MVIPTDTGVGVARTMTLVKGNLTKRRDDPYWTCGKNSLELIELSSINKVSLV